MIKKPHAHIWVRATFLAYNLAKFQYFYMRPTLNERYYFFTLHLKILALYLQKWQFYVQKTSKNGHFYYHQHAKKGVAFYV